MSPVTRLLPLGPFRRFLTGAFVLVGLCGLATPTPSRAATSPLLRPWVPPGADSLLAWAAEAKSRFQTNQGDSIGGSNYRAYDLVGRAARRMLNSLGREHMLQAYAVGPVLDSLGLDTSISLDPALPEFVLMVVRNPYRPSALAVGFLFWFRGDDLRTQGVMLSGGLDPRARAWWTARSDAPYEWGIVYRERGEQGRQHLLLLRLNPDGYYWNLVQYETNDPDLGEAGEVDWIDVNHDGRPELVAWTRAHFDSSFTECPSCPHLINEKLFAERETGLELHDSRLLPSPYSTFVTFVRLLREQNRAAAGRLLVDPAKLEEAVRLGWGARVGSGAWNLEYAEQNEPWPQWLAMRFQGPRGVQEWVVHFAMRDARWIIRDWAPVAKAGRPGAAGGAGGR